MKYNKEDFFESSWGRFDGLTKALVAIANELAELNKTHKKGE